MHGQHNLATQLHLERAGESRYQREISPTWLNRGGRVFGGYTAALCFAAAARRSPHDAFSCGHVLYLAAVVPGVIDLHVTAEKVGRTASAMRVAAVQFGETVLTAQIWLRQLPDETADSIALSDPDNAPAIHWLKASHPFHCWLDGRAIDHPASFEDFADGKHELSVWSRPEGETLPRGATAQLFDVILADAHLGDCVTRGDGAIGAGLISLDLTLHWTADLQPSGWRKLSAASLPSQGGQSLCQGTISSGAGVCAKVIQQIKSVAIRA